MLEANSVMGNTFINLGRIEEAGASFEETIRLADELAEKKQLDGFDADQSHKMQCLSRLQKVQWLLKLDRLDEATKLWEQTRDEYPGFPETAAVFMQIKQAKTSAATR